MSPTLRPNYLLNGKHNRVPICIFSFLSYSFLVIINGEKSSVLVCKLKAVYFPSASVSLCSYQSLTTEVAAPRDHWACLSASERKCVHLCLCVYVYFSLCVCVFYWVDTDPRPDPTNQMLWTSSSSSLSPYTSIHLFLPSLPPPSLPSWLCPLWRTVTVSISRPFTLVPPVSLSHEAGSFPHVHQ